MTLDPKLTKERLLDAAEGLFATQGFDGTSLRAITSEAGVNLAAVNYHFRSKDELNQAVFARRLEPINRRRLELLDECIADTGKGLLPLEGVIRALINPVMDVDLNKPELANFKTLMGRLHWEPKGMLKQLLAKQFGQLITRFTEAFQRALPELAPEELFWRIHFMVGSMAHTLACQDTVEVISGGLCDTSDVEGTRERLVSFIAAGMRSPVPDLRKVSDPVQEPHAVKVPHA